MYINIAAAKLSSPLVRRHLIFHIQMNKLIKRNMYYVVTIYNTLLARRYNNCFVKLITSIENIKRSNKYVLKYNVYIFYKFKKQNHPNAFMIN